MMKKDILRAFRLVRYSDTITTSLLFSILSLCLGLLTLITTKNSSIGAALIVLCPSMISFAFISLTLTESIAVSPKRRILEIILPNIFVSLSGILAYVILTIFTVVKLNSSTYFYSFADNLIAYKYYIFGILSIVLTVIFLPHVHKYLAIVPALICGHFVLYKLISGLYFNEDAIYNGNFNYLEAYNFTMLYVIGIIIVTTSIVISCKLRIKHYHKPVAPFLMKLTERSYKKSSQRTQYISKKYYFVISAFVIIGATVGAVIWFFDTIKPDGWYTKDNIKEQYKELLVDCGKRLTFDNYTITLEKQYYDSVTEDACCLFKIEANEAAVALYNEGPYAEGNQCLFYTSDHKSSFGFGRIINEDYNSYTAAKAVVDGSGVIDIEYEYDKDSANILYIYMYMNMIPQNDSDTLSIYFMEEQTVYEHMGMYGSRYSNDYSDDVWKSFKLTDTSESLSFEVNDIQIAVSRAGIICYDRIVPSFLSIVMEDGETVPIVQDSSLTEGFEKYETKDYIKYCFNELIDIDKVADIKLDGEISKEKFDDSIYFSSNETYNLKQTIQTEWFDEEKGIIKVNMNLEWTQMPEYRNTDFVVIALDGVMPYEPDRFTDEVSVTHRVYETVNGDENTGQWIEAQYTENESIQVAPFAADGTISNSMVVDVVPNQFDTAWEGICIYPALHENSDNRTYTRESLDIEFYLLISGDGYKNPNVRCIYTHHKDDISGKQDASSLTAGGSSGIVGCQFNQKIYLDKTIE